MMKVYIILLCSRKELTVLMGQYNSHKIYINSKGVEVPSVTTILKILDKPALKKWANIMGFKRVKIEDVLKKASEVGTLTHNCIEAYLKKEKFEIPPDMMKYSEELLNRFRGFVDWYKSQTTVEPILLEEELVSDTYGGTMDFYGDLSGKLVILDHKTSGRVYASMFLQLAAYALNLESQGRKVDGVGILHITERGTNLHYKSIEELAPYKEAFLMLVDLFHAWYNLNIKDGWGSILE